MNIIKIVKQRLGAIVAPLEFSDLECIAENDQIKQWSASARKIMMFGAVPSHPPFLTKDGNGFRYIPTKSDPTTLKEILLGYLFGIPGEDTIAITKVGVDINVDKLRELLDFTRKNRMERTWASYSDWTKTIILTTTMVPHILRDLPEGMTMEGDMWYQWIYSWLVKYTLPHRLFSMDQFGVATPKIKPIDIGDIANKPSPFTISSVGANVFTVETTQTQNTQPLAPQALTPSAPKPKKPRKSASKLPK